jgi:cytochrome c biogenesis protein CcdA
MNPLGVLALGLLLGLRHAADPDHVIAVSAITARTRRVFGAAWLGVAWGLGHTLTLFAVGIAIILFNVAVPPRVGLTFEFAVAIALMVVGLLNLNRPHAHEVPLILTSAGGSHRVPAWRAFGVGLLHGLAGSAAVALLVLASVRDPWWACAFLLIFGFGTTLGMVFITVGIASPLAAGGHRWPAFGGWARLATGTLSIVFGAWLIYQIGWLDGLFRATPGWHPH